MEAALVMSSNDLNTLLNDILSRLQSVDRKQDNQTEAIGKILVQAQKTNGRVTALEKMKAKKVNLPSNVLYLFAIGGVIALLIVASLLKVDVTGIFK